MDDVAVHYQQPESRYAFMLHDVQDAALYRLNIQKPLNNATLQLNDVQHFTLQQSEGLKDMQLDKVETKKID